MAEAPSLKAPEAVVQKLATNIANELESRSKVLKLNFILKDRHKVASIGTRKPGM